MNINLNMLSYSQLQVYYEYFDKNNTLQNNIINIINHIINIKGFIIFSNSVNDYLQKTINILSYDNQFLINLKNRLKTENEMLKEENEQLKEENEYLKSIIKLKCL